MKRKGIRHMVIFCLKHDKGSSEAMQFLNDAEAILTSIPGVNNFEVCRQVSAKNDYDYGFSMEFDSQSDYSAYNQHPSHEGFVEERWKKEVDRFLEIDFKQGVE